MRNFVFAAIKDIRAPPYKNPPVRKQGVLYMVYKLICSSFSTIKFLLLDYNVHTFAGVATLLGELVAQTVTVLYEYVCQDRLR